MPGPVPSRSFANLLSWSPARWPLPLNSVSAWLIWPIAITVCGWIGAFILVRAIQPYPLDAFEEYELHKAMRWADGSRLYGAPGDEPFPEAYPPLYFLVLGVWQSFFGSSFLTQRILSLIALEGALGCGLWALGDVPARHIARLVFVTGFLSLHALCARFFEVGKPDMMFTLFVAGAIATGRHRTMTEGVISSLAIWLASLTKQNAPLFIVPLALWHFAAGRRRWAVLWATSTIAVIGASYSLINWLSAGYFWSWVFVWTAGHGVDFVSGMYSAAQSLVMRGPSVLFVLTGALMFRRRCPWTWCLVASLAVGVLGMSKAGGRESHLLPAAYIAALIAGSWFAELWQGKWRSVALHWGLTVMLLLAILPGLPARRDYHWIAKRARETSEWVAAVRRLDGRVAVSHHVLLARRAGAECFFSDLILEFRGLQVPTDIRARIAGQQFDYLVLCDEPRTCATNGWSELIEEHYEPAGRLDYANVSEVLPNRVYRKRSWEVGGPGFAPSDQIGDP